MPMLAAAAAVDVTAAATALPGPVRLALDLCGGSVIWVGPIRPELAAILHAHISHWSWSITQETDSGGI